MARCGTVSILVEMWRFMEVVDVVAEYGEGDDLLETYMAMKYEWWFFWWLICFRRIVIWFCLMVPIHYCIKKSRINTLLRFSFWRYLYWFWCSSSLIKALHVMEFSLMIISFIHGIKGKVTGTFMAMKQLFWLRTCYRRRVDKSPISP